MKKNLFVLFFILISCNLFSQDYKAAVGLRAGYNNGVTGKYFIQRDVAIEGLIALRWSGVNITGLYEKHKFSAFKERRLNWFYGFGAHIGFWGTSSTNPWFNDDDGSHVVIGVDGIVGLEYNIKEIPFNISIDWKPAVNIIGKSNMWFDNAAISFRYYF